MSDRLGAGYLRAIESLRAVRDAVAARVGLGSSDAQLSAFIVDGYRGVLGREPEEDTIPFYLPALRSGQLERSQFLRELTERDEAKRRTLSGMDAGIRSEVERSDAMLASFIADSYRGILGHEPDESAVPFYLPALRAGILSREQFLAELVGSLEFRRNYIDQISPEMRSEIEQSVPLLRSFIADTFRGVLEREPDERDIAHYLPALLRGDLSRVGLMKEFVASAEFRIRNADHGMLPVVTEVVQEIQSLVIGKLDLRDASGGKLALHGSRALNAAQSGVAMEAVRDLVLSLRDQEDRRCETAAG